MQKPKQESNGLWISCLVLCHLQKTPRKKERKKERKKGRKERKKERKRERKKERERESQKCAINAPNALTNPQETSGEQNLAPPQPHNRLSAQNSQEEVAGANIQFGISRSCRVTKRPRLKQHIRVHENDMHIISYIYITILDYHRIHVDIYSHTHRLIQAHFGISWNVYTCIYV